jgi:hypothetical protein
VLRSDDETRAIAIRLPSGEELQQHHVHERTYLDVADDEIKISQDGSTVTSGAVSFRTSNPTSAGRCVR